VALVIPPGYAQCSIEIMNSGDPEPWYVTHGVDVSEAGGNYLAVGEGVMGAFANAWLSYMRSTSRITSVFLTIGSDGGNYTVNVAAGEPFVGTSTAEKLPQNCAVLIQKQTLRPGRAGKGRCFLPGIVAEASVDDVGVIQNVTLAGLQTQADTWFDSLGNPELVTPLPMVLLHNQGIPGGSAPSPVERLQVDTRIATQRRRLRR
jgi:hypothetical protein